MKCEEKKSYNTKEYAENVAQKVFEKVGKKRYPYVCPKCKKYHLSSWSEQKVKHVADAQRSHRIATIADEWERKLGIEK